jgi:N-acetyl-anhydromuramyl-L-alanine amidase AmpD
MLRRHALAVALTLLPSLALAQTATAVKPGTPLARTGDEIVVCGQLFHTGTPVKLWTDPGGYDAYRVERRFVAPEEAGWEASQKAGLKDPQRYGNRLNRLDAETAARVRDKGWDLPTLQGAVDQFVLHYDVCGTSRQCFKVLQDVRGLSVHFMLDADGTIYQTLDLKESAWHATTSNTRSIGIEIAHIGAYPVGKPSPLDTWYTPQPGGPTKLTLPESLVKFGFANPSASFVTARPERITGKLQGTELQQYDFTPEQYEALTKLTATLCTVFPQITCDYPQGGDGQPLPRKLDDAALKAYHGLMGHYHVQTNKTDPGPALDWDRLIGGARKLMGTGRSGTGR